MRIRLVVLIAALVLAPPTRAEEQAPEAVIGDLYAALLLVMKRNDALSFAERAEVLAPVLDRVYDFALMTRVAVGRPWGELAADARARTIDAFRRLSIATYASRFASFDGEAFEVIGTRSTDAGDVVVATRIVPDGEEPVALDYLMRRGESGWRIADVYLTGTVSELATKRSEFAALLKQGGIEGLIAALRDKAEALARP
jgi:phospholipid transport system substrate-binding protein